MKVYLNLYGKTPKIRVRIDNKDLWNLDTTLAHIIHPALVKLKEEKQGTPVTDVDDVPEKLRYDLESRKKLYDNGEIEYWEIDNTIHQRWDWVLDEMIWSFGQLINEEENQEIINEDGKIDRDLQHAYEARIDRGIQFFGKYYRALWN